MSSKDSNKPKDPAKVDLIRQEATDSVTAESKELKNKRQRRRKPFDEAISRNAQRVYDVRSSDIIFGRGKGYQDHPGNKRMRAIIRRYKEEYNSIHRSRKRDLVESVYSEITQDGARFLHKSSEEDVFVVVDIPIALQKVRNTLRCKKSGMVPTEGDDEVLTSAASKSGSAEGSLTDTNLKTPGVGVAASIQASLPLDTAGLGRLPLASQLGFMPSSSMLQGSQLGMLPTMHPAVNPLSSGTLMGNDLLRQTQYAGLAAGLNVGLGGLQLPLSQQQALQGGIPALGGRSLAQRFPLMGSISILPGAGTTGIAPSPSQDDATSAEQNSSTQPENEKS